MENKIIYKELSYIVQGAFFQIYKKLGNYFKEKIYHRALIEEFNKLEIPTENERRIKIFYNDKLMGTYIPDLIVDSKILIEIKCKPNLLPPDIRQFWHYLRASDYKVGYLTNFGSTSKVEYIRRVYDTAR